MGLSRCGGEAMTAGVIPLNESHLILFTFFPLSTQDLIVCAMYLCRIEGHNIGFLNSYNKILVTVF